MCCVDARSNYPQHWKDIGKIKVAPLGIKQGRPTGRHGLGAHNRRQPHNEGRCQWPNMIVNIAVEHCSESWAMHTSSAYIKCTYPVLPLTSWLATTFRSRRCATWPWPVSAACFLSIPDHRCHTLQRCSAVQEPSAAALVWQIKQANRRQQPSPLLIAADLVM